MRFSFVLCTLVLFALVLSASAGCSGSPSTHNGLPCASTTRYWDDQMGACGCGNGATPWSWQYTDYTAAGSQAIFDDSSSTSSEPTWCGGGCGTCYELTPTGDCPTGSPCAPNSNPITVMVTNLCPNNGNAQWCPNPGQVNQYGYGAHFDLMDENMDGKITAIGWNNPGVTYKRVACGGGGSPSCSTASDCECSMSPCSSSGSGSAAAASSSSSSSSKSSTSSSSSSGSSSGSCAAEWGQCGGEGWNGPKCCVSGSTCTPQSGNPYYSQCLP